MATNPNVVAAASVSVGSFQFLMLHVVKPKDHEIAGALQLVGWMPPKGADVER
jgi:hypothetical protein